MNADEMRKWVAASRAKQGLPPTVEDPDALRKLAHVLLEADRRKSLAPNRPPASSPGGHCRDELHP